MPLNIDKYNFDVIFQVEDNDSITLNLVLFIRGFEICNDSDLPQKIPLKESIMNINRNKDIYDTLRKRFSQNCLVKLKFLKF